MKALRRSPMLLLTALLCASSAAAQAPKSPPKEPPIDLNEVARQLRPAQPGQEQPPAPTPASEPPTTQPAPAPAAAAAPAADPASPAVRPAPSGAADPFAALAQSVTRQGVRIAVRQATIAEGQAEIRRVWSGAGTFVDRWRPAKSGGPFTAMVEVRTGLAGSMELTIDDKTMATIGPLTRARLARLSTGDSSPSGSRVVVELLRGKVQISPPQGQSVNIVTPDGLVVVREPVIVAHDAAKGTSTMPASTASAPATTPPGGP